MFRTIVKSILLPIGLILAGCASIPLMSLPKLLSLNIETLDMSQLELAVRLPDNVGVEQGSAKIEMNLKHAKTSENLDHQIFLETIDTAVTPFLTKQSKPGYTVHRFKMTPKQEHEAQLFRQKALSMKSKSKDKIEMEMAASVGFCAFKNKPTFDDISMTFYVRTNAQKDFFALFKEQDIQFDEKSKKAMMENPKYCE